MVSKGRGKDVENKRINKNPQRVGTEIKSKSNERRTENIIVHESKQKKQAEMNKTEYKKDIQDDLLIAYPHPAIVGFRIMFLFETPFVYDRVG